MSAVGSILDGFHPSPWLPGRHLQTIVPALLHAPPTGIEEEARLVQVAPSSQVQILIARPGGKPRGTVLLIHGLVGSAESGYMRRTAAMACQRGWVAVRMNLRGCGGTEALARTLYNAGQSDDVGRVLEDLEAASLPRPFGLVGFSLGGNLALRYAALEGPGCRADRVVGANPPIELEACVRSLEEARNFIYHAYFADRMCRHLQVIRKVRHVPGANPVPWAIRSVRRFDTLYTAPDGGYASAEDYYGATSAAPHLRGLRVPTLVLSALNDPFVPAEIFHPHQGTAGGRLQLVQPASGGHLGYWQHGEPHFWAGKAVLSFLGNGAGK